MSKFDLEVYRQKDGKLQAYAWPGGYPVFYITADGGVLCPTCASQPDVDYKDPHDKQWCIVGADINWEDPTLYCDHCNQFIESAYGDDEKQV